MKIKQTNIPKKYQATYDLLQRIIPEHKTDFIFKDIPKENNNDLFEIDSKNNKIIISASSPIARTSAIHWYLKHVANCQISWCGDQLDLPKHLPIPKHKIHKTSPYKHACYFNYCTFSYTMSWWNWERWQREIDYMALSGIDMPLVIVGSEELWLNVLKKFNYTHEQAKAYIAGPAYTAWWMMGNIHGRGGPVTDQWIKERTKLAKKIVKRMRSLGITPATPGFVGLVPSNFSKINPKAQTIPQGRWGGKEIRPYVLHPDDPLFAKFAKVWYEEMDKIYGKSSAIAGDLFHEGGKTAGLNITKVARQVQGYMLKYNPKAIWLIQGWGANPKPQLLAGLKRKNTIVQELAGEFWRRWERRKGFNNFPWCFGTIIMYGGNVALHGRLDAIAQNLNDALKSPTPPVAIGAFWEGIEINPVVIDYLYDMRWRQHCPNPQTWIKAYTNRRYGINNPQIHKAWQTIIKTAYGSYKGQRRPGESLFCAKPSLNVRKASPFAASITIHYDQKEFRDAVKQLFTLKQQCKNKKTYQFDIVDMTRQFIANTGQVAYREMIKAYKSKNKKEFEQAAKTFLEILDDQDRLLATQPQYMLGTWLKTARDLATSPKQADINERNARMLITTWTPYKNNLRDYAWREWSGLLKNYYRPRWQLFINDLRSRLNGKKGNRLDYFPMEEKWAKKKWATDPYPTKPQGDPIKTAEQLFNKWSPWLDKHYNFTGKKQKSLYKETGKNKEAEEAAGK